MRGLQLRVRLSYLQPRFTKPETQLPEQSLTLTDFQLYPHLTAEKLRQGWAVPHFGWQAELAWALP